MKVRAKQLIGRMIRSADGDIGKANDLIFDNEDWVVRYVHVDTWNWLPDRKLIVPPALFDGSELKNGLLAVPATRRDVAAGAIPGPDAEISRRVEETLFDTYKLTPYWAVRVPGGATMVPGRPEAEAGHDEDRDRRSPPALSSFVETAGYEVVAGDGPIGRVEDFVLDPDTWAVEEVRVDTTDWLRGGSAAVRPAWITGIDAGARRVRIDRTREQIQNDPGYDPTPDTPDTMPGGGTAPGHRKNPESPLQMNLGFDKHERE